MGFVSKNMLVLALIAAAFAHADEMPMPLKVIISPKGSGVALEIKPSKPTADEFLKQLSPEQRRYLVLIVAMCYVLPMKMIDRDVALGAICSIAGLCLVSSILDESSTLDRLFYAVV